MARDDIALLRGLAAQRGLVIDQPAGVRRGVVIVDPKTGAKICKPDGSSVFTPEHARRYLQATEFVVLVSGQRANTTCR